MWKCSLAMILGVMTWSSSARVDADDSRRSGPLPGNVGESIPHPSVAAGNENPAGAGGAAFADFDSLMELVQTTIAPDSWEALGGSGTMSPYPQGIWVDAEGIVRRCEPAASNTALASLRESLLDDSAPPDAQPSSRPEPDQWRRPAGRRIVSLRRLLEQSRRRLTAGLPLDEDMLNLAGLSTIDHLMMVGDDVWLAGRVGGFESVRGWWVDRKSGRLPIAFDSLAYACGSVTSGQPIGCTIDPTRQGLAQAAQLATKISSGEVPRHKAVDWLREALGLQNVGVFGIAGDTPLGYRMVQADRHMKELALGIHPMPDGVPNYLDQVDRYLDQGPPTNLLLRMWFTANPITVQSDAKRQIFSLAGRPVRLSGENQMASQDGARGPVTIDPRSQDFVKSFNENWSAIAQQYPIYGSIESLFSAASVAAVLKRSSSISASALLSAWGEVRPDEQVVMPAPKKVPSLAVLHTRRVSGKRHRIFIASGGVSVDPNRLVAGSVSVDPSVHYQLASADDQPQWVQRWWWDR